MQKMAILEILIFKNLLGGMSPDSPETCTCGTHTNTYMTSIWGCQTWGLWCGINKSGPRVDPCETPTTTPSGSDVTTFAFDLEDIPYAPISKKPGVRRGGIWEGAGICVSDPKLL